LLDLETAIQKELEKILGKKVAYAGSGIYWLGQRVGVMDMQFGKILCGLAFPCLFAVGGTNLAGERKLTIRDNLGRAWVNEPIAWDLPGAQGQTVLVRRDGRPIPGQVVPTAGGLRVLFLVDRLAKDGSPAVTADLERQGPVGTDLSVAQEEHALVLANRFTAVKLNRGHPDSFSPILAVRLNSAPI
jgi:hypothetical protein